MSYPMTPNGIKHERAMVFAEIEDLNLRVGHRDMTSAELEEYSRYKAEFDRLSGQLDAIEPGQRHGATTPEKMAAEQNGIGRSAVREAGTVEGEGGTEWRTPDGRAVQVLRPEQRLAATVEGPGARTSFDDWIRAAVTGDWSHIDSETRAMSIGTATAGGMLVPGPLSARVIDKARNAGRVFQAGATTVPMDENGLKMARITTDPTAAFKLENAAITASDMVLDSVDFTARTLVALVKMSVELAEDAQGIDGVIENAMAQALALELDRAALRGSGTAPEPRGIRNQTGVTIQSTGANGLAAAYAAFSTAIETVRTNNGDPNGIIYAPRVAGSLDRLLDTTNQPLRPPPSVEAMPRYVTAQLPVNLTQGTSTDASDAYVGQWDELLIGVRTSLTIEVSRQASDAASSAFGNLQIFVRAYLRADVQLAQPSHFVVITGLRP